MMLGGQMKTITKSQYEEIQQLKTKNDALNAEQDELFFQAVEMLKSEDGEGEIYWSDLGWVTDYFDNSCRSLDETLEQLGITVEGE
jgi:hypothetical protein